MAQFSMEIMRLTGSVPRGNQHASTSFVQLSISPPAEASPETSAPLRFEDDRTIEIGLPNGRRLTIPASLDPTVLARLLPVVDGS